VSEYRPRQHDHLVEPLIGGLHGAPSAPKPRSRALWGFLAACAGVIALRVWHLLAS
jgi:hypothetical protein